jgi:rhomboid protease GluP
MCPHCRAFIDPKARVCPYCENEVGKPAWTRQDTSGFLRGLIPQTHFTTVIILTLNFGLFVASLILSMKVSGESGGMLSIPVQVLVVFGAKFAPPIVARAQWWRLVTAGFLHGGVFHILMNSWVLLDLGSHAEQIFGTSRYLVIYLVSSVFGFVASLFWSPMVPSIGASAAACGLIGAMMAYAHRAGSRMIWSFYLRWILLIVVIGLLPGFNIDNAAHLGGFVAGFAVGYLAGTPRVAGPLETIWNIAAGGAVAVVAVSFVLAYQSLSLVLSR